MTTHEELMSITDIKVMIGKLREYAVCGLAHNGRDTEPAYKWEKEVIQHINELESFYPFKDWNGDDDQIWETL